MTKVILKRSIAPRIANGHPWIFGNEVATLKGAVTPGDIVDVYFADDTFCGRGFINPKSQIMIRLLTRKKEDINEEFFYNKIKSAWCYRQKIGYTENCRLVFGEADYLPSLIIDKFNDYFSVQTLSLGMDVWKACYCKCFT